MSQRINKIAYIIILYCIPFLGYAQQDTIDFTYKKYGFENDELNVIQNLESLSPFFEKLYQLRKGSKSQVNIIQVGDSHIQADFLSNRVRLNFHTHFGNGGRGLIVPGRVAHTNEPANINTSSTVRWEAKRIVYPDQPLPIGIGGITLHTNQPNSPIKIKALNSGSLDYSFSKITLFFQKDITSFNFSIKDSLQHELAFAGPYTFEVYPNTSTIILPFLTNQITLETLAASSLQTQATLFGINLENGNQGVLYHAIGVNGAKYRHFNAAKYFSVQTTVLHPDLFILSLGTNEALDYPYNDPQLFNYIDHLIMSLKVQNPEAKFVITTPPDSYRKKTRRNPGVTFTRDMLIRYADQHNLAYWDLYTAGGGEHSADLYKQNKLLQNDGVHFTKDGYELQGNLLFSALMKAYNLYVSYRHP